MFKFFKTILVLLALISFANAASNQLGEKEIKDIEALNLFKGLQVKINRGFDNGDMYLLNVTVKDQESKIFLTKDKKFLIAGDVVDTNSGRPLMIPDMPVDLTPTIGKEVFTFGKGKDEYVLFTDPECPYCKKFESYFHNIEDKVKIRVFFFPLEFHKDAKDLSLYIMSQKSYADKVKAMTTAKADTPEFVNRKIDKKELEKLEKHLAEQMEIATHLGVSGTPSVFDKDGNKVSWAQMLQDYGIEIK